MRNRPQAIYQWTTFGWFVGVCVHLAWSLLRQRTQAPTEEVYTQLLTFQIARFTVTTLPYWLGALLAILVFEFAVFGRKAR